MAFATRLQYITGHAHNGHAFKNLINIQSICESLTFRTHVSVSRTPNTKYISSSTFSTFELSKSKAKYIFLGLKSATLCRSNRSICSDSSNGSQSSYTHWTRFNIFVRIKRYFSGRSSGTSESDEDMFNFKRTSTRGEVSRRAQENEKWKERKEYYESLPVEEKRSKYQGQGRYFTLDDVPTWTEYYKEHSEQLTKHQIKPDPERKGPPVDEELNSKISIWQGNITQLEIDSIVNAANESLLGGGGVDGAIHRAAGSTLVMECASLDGCKTGHAKITGGYKLPSKTIIHTVGPIGSGDRALRSCYHSSLKLMTNHNLRSTAFPCISTGIYGFPNDRAARIALVTTREFLEQNRDKVDRVIFCLFLPKDVRIYETLMQVYFPVPPMPPKPSDTDDDDSHNSDDNSTEPAKKEDTPSAEKSNASTSVGNIHVVVKEHEESEESSRAAETLEPENCAADGQIPENDTAKDGQIPENDTAKEENPSQCETDIEVKKDGPSDVDMTADRDNVDVPSDVDMTADRDNVDGPSDVDMTADGDNVDTECNDKRSSDSQNECNDKRSCDSQNDSAEKFMKATKL